MFVDEIVLAGANVDDGTLEGAANQSGRKEQEVEVKQNIESMCLAVADDVGP